MTPSRNFSATPLFLRSMVTPPALLASDPKRRHFDGPERRCPLFLSLIRCAEPLPLMFYINDGGFTWESDFSLFYTSYLNSLVTNSNVIVVSIDYSLSPESSILAYYEDLWAAMKSVASYEKGEGPDPGLNEDANFEQVLLAGDSESGLMGSDKV